MKTTDPSQGRSQAGQGAWFFSLFAVFWNTVVFMLLLPSGGPPIWFKAIFVLAGVAVAWGALYAWRQRLKGGGASMTLARDPVPHGIPVSVAFELRRSIRADQWLVEAKIESSASSQSGFGLLWSQDFQASAAGDRLVRAEVTLPGDIPSTATSTDGTSYRATLTLKADSLEWPFKLSTRSASASEVQFGIRDARSLGNKIPQHDPEQAAATRKRWRPWVLGLVAVGLIAQLSLFFDFDLWPRSKALIGSGAYSTALETPEFEIRVTNYLINDWALRGRLVGTGRVANGELFVRVDSLSIQPTGSCGAGSTVCQVESVSLLLAKDGDRSFSTLAQSTSIPVHADLNEHTRWSLPPEQLGTEIRMTLPAVIDADGVQLKLQIRSSSGSTVYPAHGPRISLQRALARANAANDPCERLTSKLELVRAGCHERLQVVLAGTDSLRETLGRAWAGARNRALQLASRLGLGSGVTAERDNPDELLLEALRTENLNAVAVLLAAGASPDAHSPDDKGRTALGYAAAGNDVAMVERLLRAGANAKARHANEQGQIVTPVTQALRTDAAAAIRRLLQAGASTSTQDPTGWTPLHIAAYESANLSIEELVIAGADINERTPAYRQQTALQTALQSGSAETIRTMLRLGSDRLQKDNEEKDACDWARFFKRSEEIQALVCL